ncbi:MAG: hypothetical protein J6A15_00615 [Clostridia bacterium]|nr:hypothetical protein [Clostridia bacterium]
MKFNPKEEKLPFENFNFGGRGYIRRIDDLDQNNKNGYGLLGGFMERGEDEYENGKLYLSCSRGGEKDVYHLFTIKEDKPVLLKVSYAQKGAVRTLWDKMDEFLSQRESKSNVQLLDIILKEEQSRDRLKEFATFLMEFAVTGKKEV